MLGFPTAMASLPSSRVILLYLVFIVICPPSTYSADQINVERRLYHRLLDNYSSSVRPVNSHNQTLQLKFGFVLVSLDDLIEDSQTLVVNGWLKMQWIDSQLAWNPDEYEGLQMTRLPMEQLWNPDVVLYNQYYDAMFTNSMKLELPIVYNNGLVFWVPKVRLSVRCNLDLYDFPYDQHHCVLMFGSWTHPQTEMNLTTFEEDENLTMEDGFYKEHSEWKILGSNRNRNIRQYKCCKEKYIDVTYNLTIGRAHTYHTHLFVAPSVILALLIPFIFILPPESNEKSIFGWGLMVGNILLLGQMQIYIPVAHHTVPRIGMYYLTNIILIGVAMLMSTIVTNIWHRSNRKGSMPSCLRGVIGILSRLFCVNRDDYLPEDDTDQNVRRLELLSTTDPSDHGGAMTEDRQRFMRSFARITAASEWRQTTTVLDRLLFFIYIIVVVLTTISVVR